MGYSKSKNSLALGLLFCIVASGVALSQSQPPAPKPRATHPPTHPNVLLVTIDTLRADHVGAYGAKSVETPTLDVLARDGIVFDEAISQVPLTFPSHASILTGTYPFANGVQDFTSSPLAPRFRTLAQAFKAAGYVTGAVVSSFVLDRTWGLMRGFDYYDDRFDAQEFITRDLALVERKAGPSVNRAITWLQQRQTRPFFFWLHLYDPHSPYDPPEPYLSQYKDCPYDGEIAYADHELARVIDLLKRKGLYQTTVIAVVSDHGESLGEHGEKEHGFFIYDATVRVPLIFKPAARSRITPQHVSGPVEIMAVAPTLLELAGIKDPLKAQAQTQPLITTAGIARPEDGAYSETFYPFSSFGWHPLRALHAGEYEYIEAPDPELYNGNRDPQQSENVIVRQSAVASSLKLRLQEIVSKHQSSSTAPPGSLDPEAAEKLRRLGYMAFRSPVAAEDLDRLPDPKQKVGELNDILNAQDAFHAGNFEQGEALLRRVRAQDPKMYLVPFMLAEAAMRQSKWEQAAAEFRDSLKLNPDFEQSMTGLATALLKQGQAQEAKRWLEKALKQDPQSFRIHYQLGVLLQRSDSQAAKSEFLKAMELQPSFPFVYRDLGFLEANLKNYSAAKKHLSQAVILGVSDAKVFNQLGICQSQLGELKEAIASYKSALKLDPNLAEAHLNLAYAYQRLPNPELAKPEYREACRLQPAFCKYGR